MRVRVVGQDFDDAAVGDAAMAALADHAAEFAAKRLQTRDLGFDVGEHVAGDAVDARAGLIRLVHELQELADGVEREAEFVDIVTKFAKS